MIVIMMMRISLSSVNGSVPLFSVARLISYESLILKLIPCACVRACVSVCVSVRARVCACVYLVEGVLPHVPAGQRLIKGEHHRVVLGVRLVAPLSDPLVVARQRVVEASERGPIKRAGRAQYRMWQRCHR